MVAKNVGIVEGKKGHSDDVYPFDVHESVHRDIIMNTTNKMQLYRLIHYF
jgi:hypothetical protein